MWQVCEELTWNDCTSTPHRSGTNGIAERAVRRIEKGTSAVLLQPGLDEKWWADCMECYFHLRIIQDLLSDGKAPYGRRFGMPFNGPVYPVWSNGRISPYFCERLEVVAQMDASELHARRLNAKEVSTPMKGEKIVFPVADGIVKISGEDQRLRTSTFIWNCPDRAEEVNLRGESDGSSSTPRKDSSWYDGKARK